MSAADTAPALPSFEHSHKQALRECRFVTTNVTRTVALVYDADELRIRATGLTHTRYERAPGVYDYEARSSDARVIEFVASLASTRLKEG
jgi:hypothetical protein